MSNPRRGGRAGQEEEGERTSVGANGTFAAVSNVKRRMLASTDAYITSTWDDLAGGFQWGLTPPVGSIPCYANLSTVGLGVVDRGSKIIPRSAGSLLFLRFSFFSVSFFFLFFISPAVSPFPRSSANETLAREIRKSARLFVFRKILFNPCQEDSWNVGWLSSGTDDRRETLVQ